MDNPIPNGERVVLRAMQQTELGPAHAPASSACGVAGLVMAIGAVTVVTDGPGRVLGGDCRSGIACVCKLCRGSPAETGNHRRRVW